MSAGRFDAIVIGAGFSGLYALHRLRELGLRVRGHRAGRQGRRDVVVQPVPGRALRHREHRVLLQLLRRDSAGVGVDRDDARPARGRGLPQLRRRPAGPPPRHPVQHQRRLDDVRRVGRGVERPHRVGGVVLRAVRGRSGGHPVGAAGTRHRGMDTFTGTSLFTSRWPRNDVDLTGKRVGVIGTGSTGVQLIPVVAKEAAAPHRCFSVRPHTPCRGGSVPSRRASWTR